jgi:soluble lytic murein transglycosylase-like protein
MRVRVVLLAVPVLVLTLVPALFPAVAAANYAHVVQPGESLSSVARIDGLSVAALARANGISPQAQLITGQTLWIPPRTGAVQSSAASRPTTTSDADGDGDHDSATTPPVSTDAARPTASTAVPVPTAQIVSSEQISAVAAAHGVPAALAEAVAWQESGWNNAEVSKIGAIGVMQIIPSTWTWIDRYLTPSDPLGTASAAENVRAGVLLLHQLLQATAGNERLAVGGYFQGLASIRRFGMYPSTQRYVSNVLALAARF